MSRKTILGTVTGARARKLRPIATVGNVEIFPIRGAEDDDDPEDPEDPPGDDPDPEDPEDDDPAAKDEKGLSKDHQRAIRQAIERKKALQTKDAELAAANERLRELENKDKSELEKLQSDYSVLEKDRDSWKSKYEEILTAGATKTMELEALKVSPVLKYEWRDLDDVLTWLGKQESVTVEEDGNVTGIKEALKTLAKAKPHWLKEPGSGSGGSSGGSSGGNIGGARNGKGNPRRKTLEEKYPGLTRNRT